jgi:putative membrane protein
MKVDRFFSPEARERVKEAVRAAEARSTGQIVPVVVERSAHYEAVPWIGGVLLASLATAAAPMLGQGVTVAELPFVQLAAGLAGALLAKIPWLERLLTAKSAQDWAVRERAEQAFLEHGLYRTQHGTGVLVFASLRERRAVVMGDAGIHAKMGDEEWRRAVEALVAGIRRGAPADGFAEAIGVVGAKLAEHFPRTPGEESSNELPDELSLDR